MKLRIISADGTAAETEVRAPLVRLGRDPACEVPFDPVQYAQVSSQHARLERSDKGLMLTPLSRSNKTLLNDQPLEQPTPVKVGDRIRLGFTGPTIEIMETRDVPAARVPSAQPPSATARADASHLALLRGTAAVERLDIGKGGIIGREQGVAFVLDHPHVSRRHARVTVKGDEVLLSDLGSANGTFVNGARLTRPTPLEPGDRVDIGPFSLDFDGTALASRSRSNNVELAARGIGRVVKDPATGKPLTLLDDVSLVVRPREFVCLLGPSGSGKSTLLNILSGRAPPDDGAVLLNGQDLYANFAAFKQDIVVVPQRDVLHMGLTVEAALGYTAQLRLPPDLGRAETAAAVGDILDVVGLSQRRRTQIRLLSGGQLKRASLANEILSKPSLIFLDEVTSGLDEETDREMMELFRLLADSGKTVVCITHHLANVEANCHLVVILTAGGRLAFAGPPAEALAYFKVKKLGDILRTLGERSPEEWQEAFRASPAFARHVKDRLPRRQAEEDASHSAAAADTRSSALRQALVLTRRYLSIWRGDVPALLTMLGQSLLIALLIGMVFGTLSRFTRPPERVANTVNLLFLAGVSCFWLGCNNAAKELVKERIIYSRERDVNLRADSYFASKLVVLFAIGFVQVTLLFGIIRLWCGPPGNAVAQWLALVFLMLAGTTLGLLLSAVARTEEVALALVPVAVMPQIILAGVIAPLSGLARFLAETLVSVYRGVNALELLLPQADRDLLARDVSSYPLQMGVILAHLLVFLGGTLWLLSGRHARS